MENDATATGEKETKTKLIADLNRFMEKKAKEKEEEAQSQLIKYHYVPFGDDFYLHPNTFVLGITLEWVFLPKNLSAYVIGKSSLGRRGLIIATATGVHPTFTGCLTLELTNVGEIPIAIKPGTKICQLFIHQVESIESDATGGSQHVGFRKPTLGNIDGDEFVDILSK